MSTNTCVEQWRTKDFSMEGSRRLEGVGWGGGVPSPLGRGLERGLPLIFLVFLVENTVF